MDGERFSIRIAEMASLIERDKVLELNNYILKCVFLYNQVYDLFCNHSLRKEEFKCETLICERFMLINN